MERRPGRLAELAAQSGRSGETAALDEKQRLAWKAALFAPHGRVWVFDVQVRSLQGSRFPSRLTGVVRKSALAAIVGIALGAFVPAAASAGGPAVQPRVVGGSPSTTTRYRWQAAVVRSTIKRPGQDAHQRQFCGGSLIAPQIVITAAHCVDDNDPDCNSPAACLANDPNGDGTRKVDPGTTLTSSWAGPRCRIHPPGRRSRFRQSECRATLPRTTAAALPAMTSLTSCSPRLPPSRRSRSPGRMRTISGVHRAGSR